MEKKVWIGMFIAFVMIFSVFGVVLDSFRPVTKLDYNDYQFTYKDNQFFTKIGGVEHGFLFFPGDLEYIVMPEEVKVLLSAPVFTVTYDSQSLIAEDLANSQYFFEAQLEGVRVIERGLTNNTGSVLPQKTCADATPSQPVIELRYADESSIAVDNNCVILNALSASDIYRESERFIYALLGVMS